MAATILGDVRRQAERIGADSAVDEIVAGIRKMISSENLGVGDSLPTERALCKKFSTSRNTVREAMRILKAYGLVDVRPKVGATITDNRMSRAFDLFSLNMMELSRETFADIQGFRVLLEVASVDLIFDRVTAADNAELRQINERLPEAGSIAEASEIDFRFHTRLISLIGNKAILEVYSIMKPVIIRIMEKGKTRRTFETSTYREHAGVLDALAARDRVAYQYLLKTHLEAGFANFHEAMAIGG